MKILFACSVMPIKGGVASYVDTLVTRLRVKGYDTEVINVIGDTKEHFTFFNSWVAKIISILLNLNIVFYLFFVTAGLFLRFLVWKSFRKSIPDVVHAQDINAFNAVYKLCKTHNVKLLLTIHGHLYNSGTSTRYIGTQSWLSKFLLKNEVKAYKNAQQIIVVSDYSFNLISQYTDANKIHVIRNFVSLRDFYPLAGEKKNKFKMEMGYENGCFIGIYAGRLIKSKGLIYLLQAMSELKYDSNLKVIIAGDGPERSMLEAFTARNGLNGNVRFIGEVTKDELAKIFGVSDVFVMPSVTGEGNIEGTPMAILEALACGLPVIATPVGGIPQVIKQGKNGLLVAEKDSEAICNALHIIYSDISLKKTLSEGAILSARADYSIEKVADRIISLYGAP